MAIVQISRIQNRTGNLADLPQLDAGEMGFASDARRLFIGNDTTRTGDPSPNNTEILTQYSNISINQIANVINPQTNDVIQYDGLSNTWINQPIYIESTTIHGDLGIEGNFGPLSNARIKITGGQPGDVLQTDGGGNLTWLPGTGTSGTSFSIVSATSGANTTVTAADFIVSESDPVIIAGMVSSGNLANRLNGNLFYAGNITFAGTNVTITLYQYANLTGSIVTTGTYTSNGEITTRTQASGSAGAIQLSDGSGRFVSGTGFSYDRTSANLLVPNVSITANNDTALTILGGANIQYGNVRIVTGNLIVGNTSNANSISSITVAGNLTVSRDIIANGNVTMTGTDVTLGTISNVHILGGTARTPIGSPVISGTSISNIAWTDFGLGYPTLPTQVPPTITFNGTTGNAAQATISLFANGAIDPSTIVIVSGGDGYVSGVATVSFSAPPIQYISTDGRGNLSFGNLGDINTYPSGSNTQVQYNDANNFGSNAFFTFNAPNTILTLGNVASNTYTNVSSNSISFVVGNANVGNVATIQGNASANYTNPLTLPATVGTNKTAIITANPATGMGAIQSLNIVDGGYGYLTPPTLTIASSGALGAIAATASTTINSNGVVITATIDNGGSGYSPSDTPPIVTVSPPPTEILSTDGRGNLAWFNSQQLISTSSSPTGAIIMWPGTTPPEGYLLCLGQPLEKATFANLFAVLGTIYGGNVTHFNLPDYAGRMPIGAATGFAIGNVGGFLDATLVEHTHTATSTFTGDAANLTHTHNITDPQHSHNFNSSVVVGFPNNVARNALGAAIGATATNTSGFGASSANIANAATGISINNANITYTPNGSITTVVSSSGSSATNRNLPPYLSINFAIKL